jgi:hypothetical protein
MYPGRELRRLAAHKAAIRQRIWLRRIECTEAARRVAKPLRWLDRMLAFWRRLSPLARLAAVPVGALIQRAIFPRRRILGSLVRWGPIVYGAIRGVNSAMKGQFGTFGSSTDPN